MSEVRMRASADNLESVLRRQTPTEDAKHPSGHRRQCYSSVGCSAAVRASRFTWHRLVHFIHHSDIAAMPKKTSRTAIRGPLNSRKPLLNVTVVSYLDFRLVPLRLAVASALTQSTPPAEAMVRPTAPFAEPQRRLPQHADLLDRSVHC